VSAAREEEHARAGVIKLSAVVALNGFYGGTILSGHICKKLANVGSVSDFRRSGNVHK
jgi:hypothetical protein